MRRAAVVVLLMGFTVPARADLFKIGNFSGYGDFRFRAETDWDSQSSDGTTRSS